MARQMTAPNGAAPWFVTVSGHRLAYAWAAAPPADAQFPTLVFLHEGLGSMTQWRDFPAAVAGRTGCGALLYDRWGSGSSEPRLGRRSVTFMHDEALKTLPELLETLGIARPILVGHSDGASIAIILAGAGLTPVAGLILEAPHVFVESLTVRSIAAIKTVFERSDLKTRLMRHHGANTESMFHGWTDIWLSPEFLEWNITSSLRGIHCPLLVIQGADDHYGTVAQVDAIRREVQGPCETVLLPHCGHAPHIDQRSAAEDAAVRFIRALVADA
jgi:pimeloyl-ACP methyl ester carboxylesterase